MKIQTLGKYLQIAVLLLACATVLLAPFILSTASGKSKANPPRKLVAGAVKNQSIAQGEEIATLAGGCFWAMQTEFAQLKGVKSVVAGYSGGNVANPSYEAVCSGTTGHAEAIEIVFDPKVISYADLLRIFLTAIDPTTLNRQGPDEGTQYRSAIFFHDKTQEETARKIIEEVTAKKVYRNPIVTEVTAYQKFYPAEDYHQDYYLSHSMEPYCATVVAHEVRRFQDMNRDHLKP